MNRLRTTATLALLTLFVGACTSGGRDKMNAEEYMDASVSMWNVMAGTSEAWLTGARAAEFSKAVQGRKNLARYKPELGKLHGLVNTHLTATQKYPIPEDAAELHAKLIAYLNGNLAFFATMRKVAELPDGFTDEQFAPLGTELDRLGLEISSQMDVLDQAQKDYAKKHRIRMQEVGG